MEKETENTRLQECIKKLKEEFEEKRNDVRSTTAELENEIESLKNSVASLEKEKTEAMSNYSEEYMRFHNEGLKRVREEAEKFFQLEILKKDLENENLKKEIEEIKNLYVEVFNSKEALLKELEKEKNHPTWPNSSGNSNNVVDVDEVKRLQKELEKSRNRILELDQTLKQQYEQEVEILNLDINRLNLQVEKVKKEKDREIAEKDKICLENELLKSEIEHVTSEKNLLFLNLDKLQKEMEEVRRNLQIVKEGNKNELKELKENYDTELQNLTDKYEIIIKKLKKEVELTLAKTVRYETKYTSPKKNRTRNVESQCSPTLVENKSISPRPKTFTKEMGTSPVFKSNWKTGREGSVRNISVLTDPEVNRISKKEIVEIMEKLGAHHENEMRALESKYRIELGKLDKKFQIEVDKAKELIREELEKAHVLEMERLRDKHKIEMENRIEQEKKEAVAELITEWACEVQGLKASYAEAQTEMERMKMKYKAAKSVALQYKVRLLVIS